ncbi:MAG: sensor histidine kinase [bacterium]
MDQSHSIASNDADNFLPDFCAIRTIFVVVVSAELFAMVLALASGSGISAFWSELSLRSLYVQWIALCSAAALCALRSLLNPLGHTITGLIAWILIVTIASIVAALTHWLAPDLILPDHGFSDLIIKTVAISGIVGAVVLRYLYENFQQNQRQLAESRSRYQALQARIRPHFLFNSMNTIASLTRIDPVKAETMVQDLSDLFRAALGDEQKMSTLGDELELGKRYLAIEQQRLGTRLILDWQTEALPAALTMPPLTLQPLLENAVYHGIEPARNGGKIEIRGDILPTYAALTIFNTTDNQSAQTHRSGAHMAMDNVRQRLASVFGESASLKAGPVSNGFLVELHLPWKELSQ